MKSLRKILTSLIVISILSITVLPVISYLLRKLNFNENMLWSILDIMSDFAIVKASDTDFQYSGNLYVWVQDFDNPGSKFKIDSAGCNTNLEYSINGEEYKEFEYLDVGGYREWSSKETEFLDLNKETNTLIVRRIDGHEIYLKAVLIQVGDTRVAIQDALAGHSKGKGANIAIENDGKIEVSIDNGETFQDIPYGSWGIKSLNSASTELFTKNLIIRNKQTGEEIYRTPEMDEIEEKVVYKNGKTILNFKNENLIDNFTTYEYVIDGVSSYGDTVEVEKNVDATLKVNTVIDFIEKSAQKEIKIDVVKVSNPIIDINEEGILNIVAGNIENDELKSIFYSINGENYKEFSEQETLKPGTYKIKAYQVSSATGIKSDEEEKEFTIEEKPVQEDIDYKEDKGQTVDKESQENDSSINEQNKNGDNSLNITKTGDNIFIFIVLIISVIAINVMHNNKKK